MQLSWIKKGLNLFRITVTKCRLTYFLILTAAVSILAFPGARASIGQIIETFIPNLRPLPDPSGKLETYSTAGFVDETNPFFQELGTNGRRCVTCHQPADAWSVTPPHIQERFDESQGTDPIFRPVDGATCPTVDTSTVENRKEAYKLLLTKGLIRIGEQIPPGADFIVTGVDNPYGCNDLNTLSMYRRPLPATNLGFLSTVMWDGREFPVIAEQKPFTLAEVNAALHQQAIDATEGHAQGQQPTDHQVQRIVDFELALFTAQSFDNQAGPLHTERAHGGPVPLSQQNFFLGINDPLGNNPTKLPFTPVIFTLYQNWLNMPDREYDEFTEARESIARGELLFNSLPIKIKGVGGLNDMTGTCGTCHDAPAVGNHSFPAPLNIGVADGSRRTPDMPLFTFSCNDGTMVETTDPGRALVTGKCADIGKFKGPILRGLAARAPYFHNGMAATLDDVVTFYQQRFDLGLTDQQQRDLVAFLKSL